jgi:hypothetical protein
MPPAARSTLPSLWRFLSDPLGEWRTQLLWRFFGVFIYQMHAVLLSKQQSLDELLALPHARIAALGCGVLLMLFGPSLLLLSLTAIISLLFVTTVVMADNYQYAEEYLPLVALPALGALLALLARRSWLRSKPAARGSDLYPELDRSIDEAQISLFRVSAVIVMACAALHKFNSDFFDPSVSCATTLSEATLGSAFFWPWIVDFVPYLGFLGEALTPVLLLLYPRIGVPFAVAVMSFIGQQGATPFTMLVMVMACAFLRPEDGAVIRSAWQRHWSWMLVLALVGSHISNRVPGRPRPWFEYHVFELVVFALAFSLILMLAPEAQRHWQRLRRGPEARGTVLKELMLPRLRVAMLLPPDRAVRGVLIGLIAVGIANGLTPYLGLKYRFSFAMFSNLRVDELRWNSLVMPRWLHLREHDPFIHLTEVRMPPTEQAKIRGLGLARQLHPGLFSRTNLEFRLESLRRLRIRADVDLVYRGEPHSFDNAALSSELQEWLSDVPRAKLFQPSLGRAGKQRCVH